MSLTLTVSRTSVPHTQLLTQHLCLDIKLAAQTPHAQNKTYLLSSFSSLPLPFFSFFLIFSFFTYNNREFQSSTKVDRWTGITNPHAPITEVQPLLTCGQPCFSSLQPCIILKPLPDIGTASFQLCFFQCLYLKDKASFLNTIILPIGSHRK